MQDLHVLVLILGCFKLTFPPLGVWRHGDEFRNNQECSKLSGRKTCGYETQAGGERSEPLPSVADCHRFCWREINVCVVPPPRSFTGSSVWSPASSRQHTWTTERRQVRGGRRRLRKTGRRRRRLGLWEVSLSFVRRSLASSPHPHVFGFVHCGHSLKSTKLYGEYRLFLTR